jgi:hypothetical protein
MVVENAFEENKSTDAEFNRKTDDLFEVVAKVEEQETGVFDAPLNRAVARKLAEEGYSLKPDKIVETRVNDLFSIIINVEQNHNGVFRATLARHTAIALVEAGCSR